MTRLSDDVVSRLRSVTDEPDLAGTRYLLGEEIGRGGMGVVWSATDVELGREVAIKVLPLPDDSPEAVERLRREARILATLEHPGIVPVHDLGRLPDGRVFYAMKLVRGERLDEHLRCRELPLSERLRLFERICEPVAFAHARAIVHRDLKPSNIMIGSFGEVLVLDWGIARGVGEMVASRARSALEPDNPASAGAPITAAGSVIGTPGFMAPEQERGEPDVDARADVYALGAILRQMCGESGVPRAVRAIVSRAMLPAREGRYADAGALAREIARWLDGLPVEAYRENVLERAGRLLGRHRALVALVVAYLLMRAILLMFFAS